MSGDSKKETDGGIAGDVLQRGDSVQIKNRKKNSGVLSRIFNGIFRSHGDDFEKRLEYISKEEAAILSRMKRRSHDTRGTTKNLIIFSSTLEVVAVGFAIMTTRSVNLSWQMRAMRVLPMFLLPVLAFLIYSVLGRYTRMRDRMDENNLEKLRAERQEKIDELKEKTNYYTTNQLIQRYDPDPFQKAYAASVLASKLGADSGMKVFLGEESMLSNPTGKSSDVEFVQPGGLRNRKQSQHRANSVNGTVIDHPDSDMLQTIDELEGHGHHQMVVDHFQPTGSSPHDGSWISRLAALLVGEDPTQSYALICGNCHMHNGLAKKEDFPYITYYCPHCKVLNRPKQQDELISGSTNPVTSPSSVAGIAGSVADIDKDSKGSVVDTVSTDSPVDAAGESISSLSSVVGAATSDADIDKDNKDSVVDAVSTGSPEDEAGESSTSPSSVAAATSVADIDKDDKDSVVDTISTGSPVAAAGESISSLSSVAGAATSDADIDKDNRGSVVDAVSTGSPVDEAGESITSPSAVAGAAISVADIDKDDKDSVVDTVSTGIPVAAAGEGNTKIGPVSPQAPSSS